jgi:hypothetical protein
MHVIFSDPVQADLILDRITIRRESDFALVVNGFTTP